MTNHMDELLAKQKANQPKAEAKPDSTASQPKASATDATQDTQGTQDDEAQAAVAVQDDDSSSEQDSVDDSPEPVNESLSDEQTDMEMELPNALPMGIEQVKKASHDLETSAHQLLAAGEKQPDQALNYHDVSDLITGLIASNQALTTLLDNLVDTYQQDHHEPYNPADDSNTSMQDKLADMYNKLQPLVAVMADKNNPAHATLTDALISIGKLADDPKVQAKIDRQISQSLPEQSQPKSAASNDSDNKE